MTASSPDAARRSSSSALDETLVLPVLIRERAREIPDHVFLIDADRGSVTYAQFQHRVEEFVGLLRSHGVGEGDRVGVLLTTCIDEQAIWIACGWLKAAQVPINPAYRGEMLRHVIADSAPKLAITLADRQADVAAVTPESTPVLTHEPGSDLGVAPFDTGSLAEPGPWDVAAIIYTSGTTGPSKGVLTPWGQLISGIEAFDDFEPADVLYAPFAAFHLGGKLPLQILAYWRGTFVFRDGFKTDRFWPEVNAYHCTRAWAFHAMANFIWRQPPRSDDATNPLRSITGGPLLADWQAFQTRFGVAMRTNYGMTEAGWPIVTGDDVTDFRSCGKARAGYQLRIVDEWDRQVPQGEIGELILRCDVPWTMNLGYLGRPDESARAWRNGWFHTGDAFRCDELGRYYFVDRAKDAIRRRSENISSFEVETLVAAHPSILECAAIGVASDDGEEEIKVCVVARPGREIDRNELVAFLLDTMPRFMVPRYYEVLPALPKTPTSKVRKVELKRTPFTPATWDRLNP
jgi:crotonobetaine/carnitine-CoA ligase